MSNIERYIHAATRDNTRLSYRAAIEHFEVQWGGFLPATADSISRYLADYANTLSINTLHQRLPGIASWHNEQGFPDPTKAPHIKKVLKGIAGLHPVIQKQAKPIQIDHNLIGLAKCWIAAFKMAGQKKLYEPCVIKCCCLLGFWRAFRSDELSRLCVTHIHVDSNKNMAIFVPRSKNDSTCSGRHYSVPALKHLSPVAAYLSPG